MDLLELAKLTEAGNDMYGVRDELIKLGYKIRFAVVEGSIDAVEKLRAELLPDGFYTVYQGETRWKRSTYCEIHIDLKLKGSATAPTEPLARLSALLMALHAERKNDA